MSSVTERAAAGGRAASQPDPLPDHSDTAITARPETARGGDGPAAGRGREDHGDAAPGPDDRGSAEVPWFLRAGRAGLAPEAVTVAAEPAGDASARPAS